MSELDPSARDYIERERAAWRDADAIPTSGADRAWAAAPVRVRAIARARVARIVVVVAALTLLGLGLLALPLHHAARPAEPPRDTASDAPVLAQSLPLPPVESSPPIASSHEVPTTEPRVTADVPPPAVNKHQTPTTHPRVTPVPAVAAPRPEAVDPRDATVVRDAGVATRSDGAAEDSLDAEFRLLREARVAIRDGHLERALEICAEHSAKFPAGVLAPERRSIERRARCLVAERDGHPTPDECR